MNDIEDIRKAKSPHKIYVDTERGNVGVYSTKKYKNDIEYIRKDKAACCATCDFCKSEKNKETNGAYWYEYNCNKHDFHIAQDLTVHKCDKWESRK